MDDRMCKRKMRQCEGFVCVYVHKAKLKWCLIKVALSVLS